MRKYKLSELPDYLHVTYNKIEQLVDKTQKNNDFWKPRGLYYAKGTEWLNFLKTGFDNDDIFFNDEYLFLHSDKLILYEVTINNNILFIDTLDDLLKFANKYNLKFDDNEMALFGKYINYIDWERFSKDYDGIHFNNSMFNNEGMFRNTWFLGWDVNGGCVWNIKGVKINKL